MKIEIGADLVEDHQKDFLMVDMVSDKDAGSIREMHVDVLADIRKLPFRHTVEHIYCSHVLEHIPDAEIVTALKSCRTALVEGGLLEIYVPDMPWTLRKFLAADYHEKWTFWNENIFGSQDTQGQFHYTGFSTERMRDCLAAGGFRKIEVKRLKRAQDTEKGNEHKKRLSNIMEVYAKAWT